jgi:predicted Zn-dependent peptidase
MSGVIFQEIRESRALAYAANTYISTPPNKQYPITTRSYIGTQADKLPDALPALYSLLDSMPFNKSSFDAAKEAIVQQIRSERIIKTQIFFNYLYNKKLGLNYDIRKDVFQQVPQMNFKDLFNFQKTYISKKPRNIAIIGDPEKVDKSVLKKYGDIQEVSLKEIFGY